MNQKKLHSLCLQTNSDVDLSFSGIALAEPLVGYRRSVILVSEKLKSEYHSSEPVGYSSPDGFLSFGSNCLQCKLGVRRTLGVIRTTCSQKTYFFCFNPYLD